MAARVKREDTVQVVRGRDKGKRGTVQQIDRRKGVALVEGVNMVKKHVRAGQRTARQAGIIDMEAPIALWKLMPVCAACDRPVRVGITTLQDGTKSRVCKRCGEMLN